MMSLATIHQLSREIGRRAARERKQPLLVEQEDLNYWDSRRNRTASFSTRRFSMEPVGPKSFRSPTSNFEKSL